MKISELTYFFFLAAAAHFSVLLGLFKEELVGRSAEAAWELEFRDTQTNWDFESWLNGVSGNATNERKKAQAENKV